GHTARDPDRHGDRHGPSPGDEQPVSGCQEDGGGSRGAPGAGERGHCHRHHAVAERDKHERAQELRQQLPVQPWYAPDGAAFTSHRSDIGHDSSCLRGATLPRRNVALWGSTYDSPRSATMGTMCKVLAKYILSIWSVDRSGG